MLSSEINENTVFEWNEYRIKLLVWCITRRELKIGIKDLSSIIYYYLKDMLLNYHINNDRCSNIKYLSNNNTNIDVCIQHIHNNYHLYFVNNCTQDEKVLLEIII